MLEPQEVLEKALAAVVGASIPDDLREVAFARAVDLIAFGSVPPASQATGTVRSDTSDPAPNTSTPSTHASPDSGFYSELAKATGVSVDRLEQLIDIHDNEPIVALRSSDLPSKAAKAQKVVALLILAARHFYNNETETAFSEVLKECKRLSCDDQNFKRNVSALPNLIVIGNGAAAKGKVRKQFLDGFSEELRKLGIAIE